MLYLKHKTGKKLTAWLLAVLLCAAAPAGAFAAEEESSTAPEEFPVSSGIEEVPQSPELSPEPSLSPVSSPVPSEEPAESAGEGESMLESEEQALAAGSLLVTGGHKTYMSGYGNALFMPGRIMTRAEASMMLYNLLAAKPPVKESKFSDVSLSQWYGTAVNSLAQAGVLSGYGDGTFLPNKTITRAEFVTALCRCFSLNNGAASFTDVPETHWAYQYIAQATTAGWISGVGEGLFQPDRGIKRCEAVTVMNFALGRTGDGFAAGRETQKFRDVPKSHWAYLQITEAAEPDEPYVPDPSPSPSPSPQPGTFQVGQTVRVVASSGLNLRSQPTTSSSVVTVLTSGTLLTVTNVSSLPWLGVKTSSGTAGYVHSGSEGDWYVEAYTPGAASGVSLSASKLSLHQYQTVRLDASVSSGDINSLSWSSSDASVAEVDYTVGYGGRSTHGAMIYAKKPGTVTLTISDAAGKTSASCTVTVTAAEGVRFGYASENTVAVGKNFDLVAVTDTSRSSVTFKIVNGPAPGTFTATGSTMESRKSQYGLPTTNAVKVFKRSVAFQAAGLYKIQASAAGVSGYQEFEVLVTPGDGSVTATSSGEHRTSTKGLDCIANFEGSVPEIKDDSIASGNPTVGYGFVVQKNQSFYNNMTPSELRGKLVDAVNNGGYSAAVNRFCVNNNLKVSQAQFDMLVSFVYNCGTGNLSTQYDTFKVLLNAVVPPSDMSAGRPYTGVLNTTGSSICAEASLTSRTLVSVPAGASVKVTGYLAVASKKQVWYKVTYGSNTGWMPAGRVNLSATGLTRDLAYIDSTTFTSNFLQWHKSNSTCIPGLLNRRLAEAKVFLYGNYGDATANWGKNTYGFVFPDNCGCKQYE